MAVPKPVLTTDEAAFGVPGVGVVVDPERATELGAFREDAVRLEDVLDAQDEG